MNGQIMTEEVKHILATLQKLEKRVMNEYKAKIVGLFGSYVRGVQTESSDVDILVRFLEGATLFDLVGLANFLEEELHVKVDVVPVDTIRKEIREDVFKEALYL